mmetsp:Transcript_47818/g.86177  ORF Transcript_47818/g.86177 Transcript_47818/m.86177 type:complete len:164 (-) Transcript_47818:2659-3150(-)
MAPLVPPRPEATAETGRSPLRREPPMPVPLLDIAAELVLAAGAALGDAEAPVPGGLLGPRFSLLLPLVDWREAGVLAAVLAAVVAVVAAVLAVVAVDEPGDCVPDSLWASADGDVADLRLADVPTVTTSTPVERLREPAAIPAPVDAAGAAALLLPAPAGRCG